MNGYVARVRRDERGFTLIELLIVIVILGILSGIVIFAVGAITDRGTVSACKTDLKTVEVAVEAYRAKNGGYPPTLVSLTTAPDQFLRPQPVVPPSLNGLSGNTLVQSSYTITYTPGTGAVDSGTPPFC